MFAPGICGELGIRVSVTGASEAQKFADINPVHRHAWNIAVQMGKVCVWGKYVDGDDVCVCQKMTML